VTELSTARPGSSGRADARRNRSRLILAAQAMFVEHGTDVSLEEVARRAGLGVATAYRNFPSRDELLQAVLCERFEQLREHARGLLADESPEGALLAWLRLFLAHTTVYRGVALPIMSALHDVESPLGASCEAMRAAGSELLTRAQDHGDIRPDIDMSTLLRLATAVSLSSGQVQAEAERLLDLVMDGVRRR
jgi:AcrR family transcriptional regulator